MNTTNIPARIAALEPTAPEAAQAWGRVIVPDGLTPDQREAWIAGERPKLPPGRGGSVCRYSVSVPISRSPAG